MLLGTSGHLPRASRNCLLQNGRRNIYPPSPSPLVKGGPTGVHSPALPGGRRVGDRWSLLASQVDTSEEQEVQRGGGQVNLLVPVQAAAMIGEG